MTPEAKHHVSGSLWLAVVLAASAGFVDAFVYLRVTPVFVANMSGNLIRFGMATGMVNRSSMAASASALLGFLCGVIFATSHLDARLRRGVAPRPVELLIYEAILLVTLPLVLRVADITYSTTIKRMDLVPIIIGAMAMGIQAVALRRVGQVAVSTTYGTGSVVRLGEKLALAMRRTARPGDHRRRVTIAVLLTVLASYVGGASVAAALGKSPLLLLVPATVPVVSALVLQAKRGA